VAHVTGVARRPFDPAAHGWTKTEPVAQWVEAASHPAIMDTSRAKNELGWVPRYTALETLRDTVRRYRQRASASVTSRRELARS
jgi:nucleoside-diphosphate-sugar epimerase